LAAACEAIGRDPKEIEITCMWPGQGGLEFINALAAVGVSRVVVPVMALGPNPAEGVQKLAEEVING
ncbi:MAG TPA: hypothetical protein VIS76_02605, partial [Pseudomonadales bacterium]